MGKTVFVKAAIGMTAMELGKSASAIVGIRPDVASSAPYVGAEDGTCLFTGNTHLLNKEQALRHAAPALLDLALSGQNYTEVLLYCEDIEFKLSGFLHRRIVPHPGWEDVHTTQDKVITPYSYPVEEIQWGNGLNYKVIEKYIHSTNPSIIETHLYEGELYCGLVREPKKVSSDLLKKYAKTHTSSYEEWKLFREIYHVHSEERVTVYIR